MANRRKGEYPVQLGGKECIFFFNWDKIAALEDAWGEDYEEILANALGKGSRKKVAFAAVLGLEIHQPGEFTVAKIMSLSPPIEEFQDALFNAWNHAYFGKEEPTSANPTVRELTKIIWKKMVGSQSQS